MSHRNRVQMYLLVYRYAFSKQVVLLARKVCPFLWKVETWHPETSLTLGMSNQDFRKIKVMDSEEYNFRRSFMLLPSVAIS